MVKKKKCFSGPPSPKFAPASIFFFSKVTKYMPMARKNKKIATFIALLHLLCGHNALNLTVTVQYICHLYVLRSANGQPVCYSVTIYSWISTPYIDIECVSIRGFVGNSR